MFQVCVGDQAKDWSARPPNGGKILFEVTGHRTFSADLKQ